MDSVIEILPIKVREKLDRKAKASGRTIEAEAAAIIASSLAEGEEETDPVESLLKTVDGIYGKNRPQSVVDEFLAERRRMWGEPPAGTDEPPLEMRELSEEEIADMDGLQRLVWEAYGRKLPKNGVDRFLASRRSEAKAEEQK
jgi:plasmid stability protein